MKKISRPRAAKGRGGIAQGADCVAGRRTRDNNQTPDQEGDDRKMISDVGRRARTDPDDDCEHAD
jgi:hypothetical protein